MTSLHWAFHPTYRLCLTLTLPLLHLLSFRGRLLLACRFLSILHHALFSAFHLLMFHLGFFTTVHFAFRRHHFTFFLAAIFLAIIFFFSAAAAFIPALVYGNSFLPTIGIITPVLNVSPLYLIGPVRSAHFPFSNVFCVASLKGALAGGWLAVPGDPLLTKPDRLNLAALFGHNNVRLGGMAWGALGLVIARHTSPSQTWVFLVHLYLAVFLAMLLGCATNCLP